MHTVPSFNTPKIRTAFLEDAMLQHFDHLNEENIQQVHDIKLSHKPLFMSLLAGEMCCFSVYMGLFDYLEEVGEKISSLRDYCLRCFQRWSREMSWTKENLYGQVDDEDQLGKTKVWMIWYMHIKISEVEILPSRQCTIRGASDMIHLQ